MNGKKQTIRRILVALDASSHSLAALDAAAELAARLQAELQGLFVEDINLLRLAELPFAREVDAISASIRPVDSRQIERHLRAQAAQARRSLADTAGRARIAWSFRVARGRVDAEVLAAAAGADLVILGKTGWSQAGTLGSTARAVLSGVRCHALLLQRGVRLQLPVLVLYDGSEPAQKALATAADLVHEKDRRLVVLIPAGSEETFQQFRAKAAEWLEVQGLEAGYRRLAGADVRALAAALGQNGQGILVLPENSPLLRDETLRDLLTKIACPVLVVR